MAKKNNPDQYRFLLIGLGPIPSEKEFSSAPGIRTWQFLQAIQEEHSVILFTKNMGKDRQNGVKTISKGKEFIHYASSENLGFCGNFLKQLTTDYRFEAIIFAGSTSLSFFLDYLPDNTPVWFDLFGSVIAEGQVRSIEENNNYLIDDYIRMETKAIGRADIFSVVSSTQRFATLGELGLMGRLNKYSNHYEYVRPIACTYFNEDRALSRNILRGNQVEYDDFVILWSGGFNNWMDEKTLFFGVEQAMKENPAIHFVATGGAINGVSEKKYDTFRSLIEKSPNRSRFHLKGWVPKEQVVNYYLEADIGINIDCISYEGELGSRNRLLGWIRYDLPILTTQLSEITHILSQNDGCFTFKAEDVQSLADQIIHISSLPPNLLKKRAISAKSIYNQYFSPKKTMLFFQKWLNYPDFSPDRLYNKNRGSRLISQDYLRKLERDSENLRTIRQKRLFRFYKQITQMFRKKEG